MEKSGATRDILNLSKQLILGLWIHLRLFDDLKERTLPLERLLKGVLAPKAILLGTGSIVLAPNASRLGQRVRFWFDLCCFCSGVHVALKQNSPSIRCLDEAKQKSIYCDRLFLMKIRLAGILPRKQHFQGPPQSMWPQMRCFWGGGLRNDVDSAVCWSLGNLCLMTFSTHAWDCWAGSPSCAFSLRVLSF